MAQAHVARTPFGIRRQLRLLLPVLSTWAGALAVLAVAGRQQITPLSQLFLDAAYLGKQPWYTGLLSEAGLIAWTVAATAAALGSWIAARTGRHGAARFLACGAAVVTAMLVDVWIQFHSSVAPKMGIPSNLAQAMIGGFAVFWPIWFRAEVMRTRWLILLSSLGFLGGSAVIDAVINPRGALGLWLEDGARLFGILTLTHYLVVTTMDILRSVVPKRGATAAPRPVGGQPALPQPRAGAHHDAPSSQVRGDSRG